ncbi:transglutaminase TgpA family protein [Pleionea sediminis]|uniref:transglutaminase TgpA family protein n=1 Tax=Pleionea sediminis TaxID=2569479 RepID=UPI0011871BDC|nr:DUF3488 and transglutaminase-like domain-containing protein [Pleionea sediminis]
MLILPESQRIIHAPTKLRLVVIQLLVLAPLYLFIPLIASLISLAPLLWVFYCSYRNYSPKLNRWVLSAISIGAAIYVFVQFGTFRGKEAGVSLIVVMYSLKILESEKYRDLNLLITLGFFVHSMVFLFTESFFVLGYMFFAYGMIVYHLMIFNSVSAKRVSWKPSVKLLAYALPIVIVFFLFFPRLPGPLWRMPNQSLAGSGFSDMMTPGDINSLNLLDEPAFRVRFDKPPPQSIQFYWRGLVFEKFDGLSWSVSNLTRKQPLDFQMKSDNLLTYSVSLEPTQQRWLFALNAPVEFSEAATLLGDMTLTSQTRITDRVRYQVTSAPNVQYGFNLPDIVRQVNLAIPKDSNPLSVQWAREQYTRFNSDKGFIDFLLQRINTEPYYYTLTPPIMRENMVDDFWFEKQSGFCEHYASSVTLMLRAVGIPARIVVGYQGGRYNQVGDYFLISQKDAHAWLEYWSQGNGWTRIDPTAAIDPSRIDESLLQEVESRGFLFDALPEAMKLEIGTFDLLEQWVDSVNSFWQEWVLDFNQSRQWDFMSFLYLDKIPRPYLYLIVLTVIGFLFYYIARKFRGETQKLDKVGEAYLRFLRKLAREKFEKKPSEGCLSFVHRVLETRPEWRDKLMPIVRDYHALRYRESLGTEGVVYDRFKRNVSHLKLDS